MGKLVVIKIGSGSFEQGFPLTLQMGEDGASFHTSLDGKLPPFPQIPSLYTTWQSEYRHFLNPPRVEGASLGKKPATQQRASHSVPDVNEKAEDLIENLNQWLNSETFRPIKDKLQQKLKTDDTVRVIIQTEDSLLRRLPWYLWDFFASYRLAEVALSSPAFEQVEKSVQPKAKVRILAILGDSSAPDPRIAIRPNINADKQFWDSLPDAETVFLVEPTRQEFNDKLWDKNGWDILFFAGHSSSQTDAATGKMYINPNESLTIPDLKLALQKAIERGLQLAIFNSCDGLGIAKNLAELHIAQIIVMREPVPDLVAKYFLKYFLSSFSSGQSLYISVREARERLHGLENYFPCASWLPVICQNPSGIPVTWQGLRGIETGINWREVCQNTLAEKQRLTTNPLTTGDGVEFTFDDIYVPLGLVEKVKKEKRPGEVSPEEGSQFYQPEEVTRTYKNDEFFAQVLKQGQSPKSQGRRLAVTGEPGAGKTTLLQKIAQWVATETEQDVAIWVSLADLQGRSVEEYLLQKWLKDALAQVRVTPEMEEALALLFNSGRVWLLLDGVDEMATSGNPLATVANQISGWVGSARVVVTCRQNVWDAGKNALEGFDVYRNLDFDYPEGVGQFIQCWFARHPELGERLLAELAQAGKERIRDTVRNPLRLALLCRAWQNRQGGLPETKAALYGQFAEALYEWKQEAFPTTPQQRRELNAALGRLALRGMEQSESRFRLREGLVTEVLGEMDEPLCQLALQLGWLNLVGVAVENPDERVYAFYHPTFQEYFAALAVDDWSYFLHHVPDNPRLGTYRIFEKQWKEVILLWFGRENVEKEKKEAFIEKLVNFDDGCRSFYEYRAYFLTGVILPEFKDSCLADEIVSQILKWCVGSFIDQIREGAEAVLVETDKKRAINRLIQLLDETSNEFTRGRIADRLGKIAVGNEGAINRLIQLLDEASDEDTYRRVAESLSEIAVGNGKAITTLIHRINISYNKYKCRMVAKVLGKIAVGNQTAITALICVLEATQDKLFRLYVAESLGEMAEAGNRRAITTLITILEALENEYYMAEIGVGNGNRMADLKFDTGRRVAESLGKIAGGDEVAIAQLIQIFKTSNDGFIRDIVTDILEMIAVKNKKAIAELSQFLENIEDKFMRHMVASILGKISVPNEKVIAELTYLLENAKDESIRWRIACHLGDIDKGNEKAILALIRILKTTEDESIRWRVACRLGDIYEKNEKAIRELTSLLESTENESTRRTIADILGKTVEKGNEKVIAALTSLLESTENESTHRTIADILGKIVEEGNEKVIAALTSLLETTENESTHSTIAHVLWKIAGEGNKNVIAALTGTLEGTKNEWERITVAYYLGQIDKGNIKALTALVKILTYPNYYTRYCNNLSAFGSQDSFYRLLSAYLEKIIQPEQMDTLVITLKDLISNEPLKNNCNYQYNYCYKLIWHCAQNLPYPEFYQAWHSQPMTTHPEAPDNIPVGKTPLTQSLEIQINDTLSQLESTAQTYPLPINIQSLADEIDTSAICQELCTIIYSFALPDKDITTVSNFAQLKQQILTVKRQLQKRHLALILHDCNPHPPLLTCCRKIADANLGLHIAWICDAPLDPPLRGFPPQQPNLQGAIQTWMDELV